MKYLEKIIEHKLSLALIFLVMSFFTIMFTTIDLFNFILLFIVAILFAFYIEYNDSNSKIMIFIKKYF